MSKEEFPKRKPNRMASYDYSSNGAYFITICTDNRRCIFSNVVVGAIHESPVTELSCYGKCVDDVIKTVPERFNVNIPQYVIMPNHIHLLIEIIDGRAIRESPLRSRSEISKIVGYIKMNSTKKIHFLNPKEKVWQRSFHDHVIRNEKDYRKIYEYILSNPSIWQEDSLYTKE